MKRKTNRSNLPTLYERFIKAQYISHSGVWIYLPKKEVFLISGFICDILDIERGEEVTLSLKEMRQSLERLGLVQEDWKDFLKEESCDFRLQIGHGPNKNTRTYRIVSEYPADDSHLRDIEGVVTDITDYLAMESILIESQKQMEATQRFARVGSFRWELDSDKMSGSIMFFDLLGLKSDVNSSIEISKIFSSFDFIDGGDFDSLIEEGKTSGKIVSTRVKYVRSDTQEEIYFGLKGHCFFFNNTAIRVEGTIHDITERYRSQKMLYQKNQSEALGYLVSGVAHDFNETLTGIVGYTEFIQKEAQKNNSESVDYCSAILKTCDKASMNIDRLLNFSGKKGLSHVPLHLHDVLQSSKTILENWEEMNLIPEFSLQAGNDSIEGDAISLQNLIINLGMNSEESKSFGGFFSVTTKNITLNRQEISALRRDLPPGEYIVIEVVDRGKGMAKQDLSKVFDPFFTSKKRGVGVGLPSSREIVRSHSGCMVIESILGEGTDVSVYLPVVDISKLSKPIMVDPGFSEEDEVLKNSGTVLVVDDEQILRDLAQHILESMGCNVLFAENGKVGISQYLKYKDDIDLVLLDGVMPELNGSDTLDILKEINPDLNVIMVSGFTEENSIQTYFDRGAVGFITKPYRRYELEGMITKFIPPKKVN